jgi:mono/diheme cytochrome c family protein
MRNSVSACAVATGDVPPLDDPGLLPGAAGHFETACAVCHASPAQPRPDSVLAMLPPPPDLKVVVPEWSDAELFEIVKHGVRFTGMPAWPVQSRDDELWSMVAFLRKLPDMRRPARRSRLAGLRHTTETFSALDLPVLRSWPTSKLTLSPSRSDPPVKADTWTKTSCPPLSGVMKPKPLSSLKNLTVPVAMKLFLVRYEVAQDM